MQIINQSKNIILADEVSIADTLFKRLKGLLGKKDFTAGQALIIKPCNSVHTFFMRFTIDVVFVGPGNRIIKLIPNMPPFRISSICFKARLVIELPAGILSQASTQIGDQILLAD